ncbi:uncharacterized protein N0V89_000404 [Didymosphaeria variabile]|uniref:FAD dependent oxidoreductase domain-containing protein n=1 Tax=Didymosphaeria variabile TaxID=1932322 RepID=A0A9W8XUM2_9PLEO|nr:uncharacterized protein N0V89_000404 [Didymosphaeria variabile]KAJ4359848.1 hypothetical protein N0V89_000404 [Didymosphaeria variabile]
MATPVIDILLSPSSIIPAQQAVLNRIHSDPGIPSAVNTSKSFWLKDPHPTIDKAQSSTLPEKADIAIIGSGITAVSILYHLLDLHSRQSHGEVPDFSIVMLEARSTSSGATGRNGGHILPTGEEYSAMKGLLGKGAAVKLLKFRFAHVQTLLDLADRLGVAEASQARAVQFVSVYHDEHEFHDACASLKEMKKDLPEETKSFKAYEAEAAKKEFGLAYATGAITGPAGALWPYKFTTAILSDICTKYPKHFRLETGTSVQTISIDSNTDAAYPHVLQTNRGPLRAKHIVHATNGYVGHLVPGFRGRVFPLRGQMSAQAPGQTFGFQGTKHSWLINYGDKFDYLTQLPVAPPASHGEMMLGGGIAPASRQGLAEIGVADDSALSADIDVHLSGALSAVFGHGNWGPTQGNSVKYMWTGIMGFSADGFPWVGKLPASLTHRESACTSKVGGCEWAAVGYSGEGMVHAWLCGKALAILIRGEDGKSVEDLRSLEEWFPAQILISDDRVKNSKLPITINKL